MKNSQKSSLKNRRKIVLNNAVFLCGALLAFSIAIVFSACQDKSNVDPQVAIINQAIAEAGAQWTAAETWVSKLPLEQRMDLLGDVLAEHPDMEPTAATPPLAVLEQYLRTAELPPYFDWTNHKGHNWMTQVRNQRQCGSCYTFAAVGAMEATIRISNQTPNTGVDFSEQHLVSCLDDCNGCNGCVAGVNKSFKYIYNYGVPPEDCFSYQARDLACSQSCSNWQDIAVKIDYYYSVDRDLDTIKKDIQLHPIATSMYVYEDFYYYESGVYEHVTGDFDGGHAVVIVGYDDANQCFIVRNSWGANWGEGGYFRIKYDDDSAVGFSTNGNWACLYYGDLEPPPAPTGVKAVNQYSQGVSGAKMRQINISWNETPSGNTYGFYLYASENNNAADMTKVQRDMIKTNTYIYDNVPGDTDFVMHFALTAVAPSGKESEFSEVVQNQDPL
ncbi:C1 family peptidase [candidate division CSSED10-310 bacterium]|uniref:C1 family peptidase n=1 Tax=candidate division CSSED10-310 bacterium TaxID=2855610 RepID=A0ABV6YTD3_UNCC1